MNATRTTAVVPTSTCLMSARWPTGACMVSDPLVTIGINVVSVSKDTASSSGKLGSGRDGRDASTDGEVQRIENNMARRT